MNTPYTVYKLATGEIIRSGLCRIDDVARQAQSGEGILTTSAGVQGVHWVVDGQLVDLVPATPSLADRKAAAKARLAERRWEVEVGGISFGGATLATDDRSKVMIAGAASRAAADSGFSTPWKARGGVWVTLNAATILAAHGAILEHVRACFAREAVIDQQIDGCSTETDVAALGPVIEAFWP